MNTMATIFRTQDKSQQYENFDFVEAREEIKQSFLKYRQLDYLKIF